MTPDPSGSAHALIDPDTYVTGVPYDALARLRRASPVTWMEEPPLAGWPGGPGFWAVLRHADVREVLRHPQVFSSQLGATQIRDPATPADLAYVRQMMLNLDPPEHGRLRGLLTKAFTPRAVAGLQARIADRAGALVAAVPSAARATSPPSWRRTCRCSRSRTCSACRRATGGCSTTGATG